MSRAERLAALAVVAFVLTALAVQSFVLADLSEETAFAAFYRSAARWSTGGPMYAASDAHNPNLLPPIVTAIVITPFTSLPPGIVPLAWTLLGALAFGASVREIARVLDLDWQQTAGAVLVLAITAGWFYSWQQGQITWLLLYPMTRAWIAMRNGRPIAAGLWLAPVIVAKPIVAVVALCWPWRAWLTAGLSSAGIAMLGILAMGWPTWRAWLDASAYISWISHPANASLWGALVRVHTGHAYTGSVAGLSALPMPLLIVAGLLAAFAGRCVRQTRDLDRRTASALLLMVWLSPLGWVYYLPLAFGPFVASWPGRRAYGPIALLVVPMALVLPFLGDSALWVRACGSAYTIAVAWAAWSVPSRERVASQLHGADGTREERAKRPRFANMRA